MLHGDARRVQPQGTGFYFRFQQLINDAKGVQVASSVADLHSDTNKLGKEGSLSEKGIPVNGRGDTPNMHDILTGSNADGTLATKPDNTCGNWTKNTAGAGSADYYAYRNRRRDAIAKANWDEKMGAIDLAQEEFEDNKLEEVVLALRRD